MHNQVIEKMPGVFQFDICLWSYQAIMQRTRFYSTENYLQVLDI